MSTCRSCGARVTWAKAPSGKWMILDEDPTAEGNVTISPSRQYGRLDARVYKNAAAAEAEQPDEPRYLDHHVTCPQAGEWRRT